LVSPKCCGVPEDQVVLIPDAEATADNILRLVSEIAGKASADDILIVYFGGHGETSGDDFILRTGPRAADGDCGITGAQLAAALSRTLARGVLVILDCCGGGGFAERAPEFFYRLAESDFRLLVSASRAGQSSWELESGGSLFTGRLLRALRGRDSLGAGGSIYFSDLFDYLHAGVLNDAKAAFGGEREQTPTFAGSHASDPLLFMNRDLTLSQVRVRTTRITPDILRRRVAMAVGAVLASTLVLAAGYWAFLDSHQYLDVRDQNIVLVHGYPGLSGFGLPHDEWSYAEGPGALKSQDTLAAGRRFVFDRQASPELALRDILGAAGRARVDLWLGDRDSAPKELLRVAETREVWNDKDLEFLDSVVGEADRATLVKIVAELRPGDPIEPVTALQSIDPSAAIAAFSKSLAAANEGMQLAALANWQGPCAPAVQAWLDVLLSKPEAAFVYVQAADTVAKTQGCRIEAGQALDAPRPWIRDAVFPLRLTNADGVAALRKVVVPLITEPGAALSSERSARLAAYWRYLDLGVCGEALLAQPDQLDEIATLDALVAGARDCPGYEASAEVSKATMTLSLRSPRGLVLQASQPIGALSTAMIEALVEPQFSNRKDVLLAILEQSANAQTRVRLVESLRHLGVEPRQPLALRLPDASDLDRELLRWLATADAKAASRAAADLIIEGQRGGGFLGVLALIPLEAGDKQRLLRAAGAMDLVARTIVTVLCGDAKEASDLLNSPQPQVRALAGDYALARRDRAQILGAARKASERADVVIARAERRLLKLSLQQRFVPSTPLYARSWRADRLQETALDSEGLSLAFEQALDGEKPRRRTGNDGEFPFFAPIRRRAAASNGGDGRASRGRHPRGERTSRRRGCGRRLDRGRTRSSRPDRAGRRRAGRDGR